MKKKIISLLIIFLILFTNYAFAFNEITQFTFRYERISEESESVKKLNSIAGIMNEETRIGSEYTALSGIPSKGYNNKDFTSGEIIINKEQSSSECNYKETERFYVVDILNNSAGDLNRYITIKLPQSTKKIQFDDGEFYIIYKNAVIYNGQQYNLKLQLNSIECDFAQDTEIYFHAGYYKQEGDNYVPYKFNPGVGSSQIGNNIEVDVTQTVLDNNGNEVPVSGLFMLADIDLEQGIALENVDVNAENVLMEKKSATDTTATDTINYYKKYIDNNQKYASYIYSTSSENFGGNITNVYLLLKDISTLNITYTFGTKSAHSTVAFVQGPNYHKIDKIIKYENEDDTTTELIDNINPGDDKTVEYAPKSNDYYLKSIKVNDEEQTLDESIQSSLTIEDIDKNYIVEILYAKKLTVQFDCKGGTPNIEPQKVIPNDKANEPAEPTKEGCTFEGWFTDETYTTPYDFNDPVTEDKILYAKWKQNDVYHNITYIILGTPNDNNATNPDKYKEGETTPLTITNPTKEGYTFSGWKENQDLTGDSIISLNVSNRNTDITLYGRWTENKEPYSRYTVNHYLEDKDGTETKGNKKYKLEDTQTKQAETNLTVTESAQTFEGYEAEEHTLSDTVTEDGTMVLNFYYNKKQYKITFDSKGGTEVNNQTKLHGEKVDEPTAPTKEGYKFLYWYEEKDGKRVIYDFDKPVNSDKNLIAEWEKIKIIPDNPTPEKEIPAQEKDTTVAQKILPNTGAISTVITISGIVLIGAIFGIRYFKLKNDMK